MATNKIQWKRIAKGDRLPCQSFLRKKDGDILKLSTVGGVEVGQDCYYLPVDDVISVINDYPVEKSEDERIINNIRKVIGWYRDIFTEKSLIPEEYQEIDAWLEKQGEHKPTAEEVLIKAGLKPYKDGNQWCVLLGDNIKEGICGFGNTIEDALYAFLKDLIASQGEQKLNGTFVNVDDVREDFVQEVYRVLDADSTNDRANQIIDYFDNLPTVTIEKQGEMKHQYKSRPRYVGEGELLGKKVDKIEPKYAEIVRTNFKDGDWVVYQNETFQVRSLSNGSRLLQGKKYQTYFIDELCRPWTIQDAKDGDVIYSRHNTEGFEWIGIFKSLDKENKRVFFYGFWHDMSETFCVCGNEAYVLYEDFLPATKEQRDLLFSKMKEAGYVWSSCKKELRKIGQTLAHCMFCNDDYTDEDRKVLCDGCNEDCKFKKKEEPVSEEQVKELAGNQHDDKTCKENGNSLTQEPVSIDFEQELYKAFGQVKDFTLSMRIAKWFYDMGKNRQEPVSYELDTENQILQPHG